MDIYFEIITWLILLHNMAITFEYLPIHDYHGLYMGLKHFIFIGVYNWHILKIQMVRVIVRVHIYYPAPFAQQIQIFIA